MSLLKTVGSNVRYSRGWRQRALSERWVPALGTLTQNTFGSVLLRSLRGSFVGDIPNRSNVHQLRAKASVSRPTRSRPSATLLLRDAPRPSERSGPTSRLLVRLT